MNFTEKEITGPVAKQIREALDMGQAAFWNPLGVPQSSASKYEAKQSKIPKAVRILLVANYIAKLKIAAGTPEELDALRKLGAIQSKDTDLKKSAARALRALDTASAELAGARETIQSI